MRVRSLLRRRAGQAAVSQAVSDLRASKRFEFTPAGEATLRGVDEPVALDEVRAS